MVVLREKGTQKSSRNIILQYAADDTGREKTVIPNQEIKKEYTMILHQKKVRLVNDETYRRKPDPSSGIYLTAAKVVRYRLMSDNRIEKEEAKNKTAKKTSTPKMHLQQN